MITLYGAKAGFGLPQISPFVTKTEVHLKMAGLDYETRWAAPQASPKGQVPFIEDDNERIADSTFIRAHIERKYGFDFDEGLDAAQRAQAWAIERMVEQHIYWSLVGGRWLDDANFAKGPAHFFDDAPAGQQQAIRDGARAAVTSNHRINGLGRHAPDEALVLASRSLDALSALLGGKLYLMGNTPCGADATAFAVLAGLTTPFFDTPQRRHALTLDNLTRYVERNMELFYPDHAWAPRQACLSPA
ncbi:MAG: glutathione S-transferase family protein [Tardiphaga sp.]